MPRPAEANEPELSIRAESNDELRFDPIIELEPAKQQLQVERASEPPFLEFRFISARRGLEYIASARSDRNVESTE